MREACGLGYLKGYNSSGTETIQKSDPFGTQDVGIYLLDTTYP
jgi:hypothetical protein